MGKRPNKARSLTGEEEEVLWEAEKFGSKTPEALIGRFSILQNDAVKFVQFTEGPTKTRQGGPQRKQQASSRNIDFQPQKFSVGEERCPVALFKQFVERRPLKRLGN